MSQKNTLFNYFTKSPKVTNGENSPSSDNKASQNSKTVTPKSKNNKEFKTPNSDRKKSSKTLTPTSGIKKQDEVEGISEML